jgi:WD40 repeat protein
LLACPAGTLELVSEKTNTHASGFYGSISCVQFSPDGSKIVSGGITDKTIKVWETGEPEPSKGPSCSQSDAFGLVWQARLSC